MVGGYTPEKVALRRAISLGYNIEEEIRIIRRGCNDPRAITGAAANLRIRRGVHQRDGRVRPSPCKGVAGIYGYVDRDGDGWREQPDGAPLVLEIATESSQIDRAFNEIWKRQLDALGLRVQFNQNQWPENLKNARAGRLMMWLLATRLPSRIRTIFSPLVRAGDRFRQLRTLSPAGVRRTLRTAEADGRWPRARRANPRNEAACSSSGCRTRYTAIVSTMIFRTPGS